MDDPSRAQLTLPSLPALPSADDPLALLSRLARGSNSPARVHLRCTGCDWRRMLHVPGPPARQAPLEQLLPRVPVRHWVFSLGDSAQPRLVARPRLRTRVARACVAAVFAWLRRAAAREPLPRPVRCGAVSTIHRLGATLEANVHVHALVLDGVYVPDPDGPPVFHPLPAPRRRDLKRTLAELRHAIDSLLAAAPPPAPSRSSHATRVVHRMARGPRVWPHVPDPRALVQRCGELDVRAGPPVAGDDQPVRARLCRYVARPPFDPHALHPGPDGRVRYRLHRPFADGTTHVELSPDALAERLRSIAAGPWHPPIAFHGVVAPAAAARHPAARQLSLLPLPPRPRRTTRSTRWQCPRCRGPLDIIGVDWGERAA